MRSAFPPLAQVVLLVSEPSLLVICRDSFDVVSLLYGLTRPQLKWGPAVRIAAWVLAVAGPVSLTLAALPLHSAFFRSGFQFSALVLVVTIAVAGGMRPAIAALFLTVVGQALFFAPAFMHMRVGVLSSVVGLAGFAAAGLAVSKLTGKLAHLAAEEAAFQRVAELVAHAVPEQELFSAAVEEAGRLVRADYVCLGRYESGKLVGVASWRRAPCFLPARGRWRLFRGVARVASEAGRWARMEDVASKCGPLAQDARDHGILSAAVLPIRVREHAWGLLLAGTTTRSAPQACPRRCIDSFADLLGAAASNVESLAELTASRARVLAAADEARRQIERDLHDGAQQRLVSLTLAVRAAQDEVAPASGHLSNKLASVADGLTSVLDDLRELARGIHPTILSEGGLVPALKTLARRSAIPVELSVETIDRLPEPVEIAAYYVTCEALANAAKHSNASVVHVSAEIAGDILRLHVTDDGDGGADPSLGSGLTGLRDRVEAIGGIIAIASPAGAGTTLDADLPLAA
jgi:signal transduction histidine kinase